MADYKPSDLFLGVIEISAILLPGSALIFLIGDLIPQGQARFADLFKSYWWIAFLVAAYFVGQLLRILGLLFEELYSRFWRPFWIALMRRKDSKTCAANQLFADQLFALAGDKILSRYGVTCTGKDLFFFAGSVVRAALPAVAQDLDRQGADYRFFRVAVLVLFFAALDLWKWPDLHWASVVLFAFAIYSGFEACYLRWRTELATYQYLLFLHYSKGQNDAKL